MIIVIGEILFDLFPNGRQMGGAPFNFAFHMKKLGFPVRFFSRVGDDELGREILDFLALHKFDTGDIQIDPECPTGTVNVRMSGNSHQFVIANNSAWSRIEMNDRLSKALGQPYELLYSGSMVQHNAGGRKLFQAAAGLKPEKALFFCDINLRPDFYHPADILLWMSRVDMLKLNEEELNELIGISGHSSAVEENIRQFMIRHGISTVILTLGSKGSLWITVKNHFKSAAFQKDRIVDTVGAGDAFAAVSAAGVLKGLEIPVIMDLASYFAAIICRTKGALPEDDTVYQNFEKRIHE